MFAYFCSSLIVLLLGPSSVLSFSEFGVWMAVPSPCIQISICFSIICRKDDTDVLNCPFTLSKDHNHGPVSGVCYSATLTFKSIFH